MALGWKLLIPVSLVWILIVACLRTADLTGVVPSLVAAAALLAVLLAAGTLRRRIAERDNPPPPPPPTDHGGFPVPPMPSQLPSQRKETSRA